MLVIIELSCYYDVFNSEFVVSVLHKKVESSRAANLRRSLSRARASIADGTT